ncbi:uncharacterized protein [Littorina saxatilis]|uniref:uncharacterized protein n=1 Tax=Littorina saxatilis TaxID=31220 RepID=UPI0038B686EE
MASSVQDTTEDTTRLRTLTEKGQLQYEDTRNFLVSKVQRSLDQLDNVTSKCNAANNKNAASSLLRDLQEARDSSEMQANIYTDFLFRQKTKESVSESNTFKDTFAQRLKKSYDAQQSLQFLLDEAQSTSSRGHSGRTHSSSGSNASSMARAKALAARARAHFAQKEYDLKASLAKVEEEVKVAAAKAERLRSEYEAELCLVAQQKDAASAEAEADAFVEHDGSLLSVNSEHPRDRTDRYVAGLGEFTHVREKEANSTPPSEREHDIHSACQFTPQQNRFVQSAEGDLAKFLLKKDLHLSRLAVFNEQAECFAVWKSSFTSVMTELSVSPQEELDLLVKHLGFESSKYAQSIRASNAADPARGLRLLWRRLDERFGSPELVEARLRERVESFPQITKNDSRKLYDLCDLCDEINSAKDDENLGPLLKVYDTSIGTNKIVAKLPPNLKHKWTERASSYKQRHPPVTNRDTGSCSLHLHFSWNSCRTWLKCKMIPLSILTMTMLVSQKLT